MISSLNLILNISNKDTYTTSDITTVLNEWNGIKDNTEESIKTFIASLIGDITEAHCLQK